MPGQLQERGQSPGSEASLTLPERQLEFPEPAQHPQGKTDSEQQPKNSCPGHRHSPERRRSEKGAGLQLSLEQSPAWLWHHAAEHKDLSLLSRKGSSAPFCIHRSLGLHGGPPLLLLAALVPRGDPQQRRVAGAGHLSALLLLPGCSQQLLLGSHPPSWCCSCFGENSSQSARWHLCHPSISHGDTTHRGTHLPVELPSLWRGDLVPIKISHGISKRGGLSCEVPLPARSPLWGFLRLLCKAAPCSQRAALPSRV